MPAMLIKREKPVYVHLHEFVYTTGALEAFLLSTNPKQDVIIDSEVPNPNPKESGANQRVGNKHRRQSAIASKFPTLVDSAADFVKEHSFAAQVRRRKNTGSSAGVFIAEIVQHLLDKIPTLKQHGISLSTIINFSSTKQRKYC